MSRNEKLKFIRLIEGSERGASAALKKYDIPRSTYYRWKRKMKSRGLQGLEDNRPYRARTWNQLLPDELDKIYEYAMLYPELSSREISLTITDHELFSVSVFPVSRSGTDWLLELRERLMVSSPWGRT